MVKKQYSFLVLFLILTANLIFGFRVYSEDNKSPKDDVESIRVLVDAITLLRKNYVDADKVEYQKLVYAALDGMVNELDKYSRFHSPVENNAVKEDNDGKFAGIGVILNLHDGRMSIKKFIPGGPAEKSDLKIGDVLLEVDGVKLNTSSLSEASKQIKGDKGSEIILTVARKVGDKEEKFKIQLWRDIMKVPSVTRVRKLPGTEIGYFYVAQFTKDTATDFRDALVKLTDEKVKGIIVDLRGNPGGMLESVVQISSYFLDNGELVIYTKGRNETQEKKYLATGGLKFVDTPLVILIDEHSASAAEILSACLHDYGKAVLVGEKSFGKGSVQTIVDLSDGSAIRFTVAKYYTKSGKSIHEVGIQPDVQVKLSEEEKREVFTYLNDYYPLAEELILHDSTDRQLKVAVKVLENLIPESSEKEILKIYEEKREEILSKVESLRKGVESKVEEKEEEIIPQNN